MSKNRKNKRKPQKQVRPKQVLSPQQSARLQRAVQAHKAGQLDFAESAYRALLAEKPRKPELFSNLAMICMQTGRESEARSLLKQALTINPRFPDARQHLATLYEQTGETEQAIRSYERLVSDFPKNFVARYLLANQIKARGDLDDAIAHYLLIMKQEPNYTQAHFSYSGVHKYQDASDPHIATLLNLYESGSLALDGRIQIAFALAKAFEDIGDYPQAFRYLESGNRLRYGKYNYAIDGDRALFENIIETFTPQALEALEVVAQQSDRPIFIVGMPRSGTTLVEKILSSHSDVYGAGELDYFYSLGVENFLRGPDGVRFRPLDSYPADIFDRVGKHYLEQIGRLDAGASRITDKLPFNFMMIGLIRIALPHAKIIHCVRDPRDTSLSIYKQNFSTENYRFAYDLKTIGQFHNLYEKLMAHWHLVMPGVIYDIEYEALTRDPENEIRKLLMACDLEWQDECLDFHRSKATVKTASFYQVRQPMYTSSVALWERYEAFLGPLFEVLQGDNT